MYTLYSDGLYEWQVGDSKRDVKELVVCKETHKADFIFYKSMNVQ